MKGSNLLLYDKNHPGEAVGCLGGNLSQRFGGDEGIPNVPGSGYYLLTQSPVQVGRCAFTSATRLFCCVVLVVHNSVHILDGMFRGTSHVRDDAVVYIIKKKTTKNKGTNNHAPPPPFSTIEKQQKQTKNRLMISSCESHKS